MWKSCGLWLLWPSVCVCVCFTRWLILTIKYKKLELKKIFLFFSLDISIHAVVSVRFLCAPIKIKQHGIKRRCQLFGHSADQTQTLFLLCVFLLSVCFLYLCLKLLTHSLTHYSLHSVYYIVNYIESDRMRLQILQKYSKHHCISRCASYSCGKSSHVQHHVTNWAHRSITLKCMGLCWCCMVIFSMLNPK